MKPNKIKPPTKKQYREHVIRKALDWAPKIYPCQKCGWPVFSGYCCETCGDSEPYKPTVDEEEDI